MPRARRAPALENLVQRQRTVARLLVRLDDSLKAARDLGSAACEGVSVGGLNRFRVFARKVRDFFALASVTEEKIYASEELSTSPLATALDHLHARMLLLFVETGSAFFKLYIRVRDLPLGGFEICGVELRGLIAISSFLDDPRYEGERGQALKREAEQIADMMRDVMDRIPELPDFGDYPSVGPHGEVHRGANPPPSATDAHVVQTETEPPSGPLGDVPGPMPTEMEGADAMDEEDIAAASGEEEGSPDRDDYDDGATTEDDEGPLWEEMDMVALEEDDHAYESDREAYDDPAPSEPPDITSPDAVFYDDEAPFGEDAWNESAEDDEAPSKPETEEPADTGATDLTEDDDLAPILAAIPTELDEKPPSLTTPAIDRAVAMAEHLAEAMAEKMAKALALKASPPPKEKAEVAPNPAPPPIPRIRTRIDT